MRLVTSESVQFSPPFLCNSKPPLTYASSVARGEGKSPTGTEKSRDMRRGFLQARQDSTGSRFWSSHHSLASGCVWLDLTTFLEKNTGTFCV